MDKRNQLWILSIASIALLISLVSCEANSSVTTVPELYIPMVGNSVPEIDHNIELSTTNIEKTAEIYRFVDPPANPEYVLDELTSVFGLSTDAHKESFDDFIIISDDKMMIDYETATGTWSFYDRSYDKTAPRILPTKEESAAIARDFLIENGFYNERFSTETVVTQYSGNEHDETYAPYCNAVYFYPMLNGKPILGVSRIVVSVGEDGQIIEVLKYYKDFVSCGTIEIAEPLSFVDGIKANQYSTTIDDKAISSNITEVELAYWEDAGSCAEQPYLQPVWVFAGTSIQPDGSESKFDVIVQAAKNIERQDETKSKAPSENKPTLDIEPTPPVQ
jgi:hypothetical protein